MNTNINTHAFSSTAHTFYETNAVAEDIKALLEETAIFLIGASRRSTEETFKLGEHLERAAELLPQGTVEKWAVERCGYTARHVRTQRAVFRNLNRYREILVELAVGPTVLGKLSAAEPKQIEEAIGFAAKNGRLRVQDVTAIVAGSKNETEAGQQIDPYDVGGLEGLKSIIALKVQDGVKSFLEHLEEIRTHVSEALLEKRLIKKTLAAQIHLTARLARKELESLAQFVMPNPTYDYVIWETKLPANTRWNDVGNLLHKIGGTDTWPEKGGLRTWLENQVLPILEWASIKTKDPVWPGADKAPIPQITANSSTDASALIAAKLRQNDEAPVVASSRVETVTRLETMLAPFGAKVTIEPAAASRQIEREDSIPSLAEALAEPPKAFKRPTLLDRVKPAVSDVQDGATSAA